MWVQMVGQTRAGYSGGLVHYAEPMTEVRGAITLLSLFWRSSLAPAPAGPGQIATLEDIRGLLIAVCWY
jgi:hypothetical protein